VQQPVRSLWLQEALAGGAPIAPPLAGEQRADVCIVGGGYVGLWTALRLRELEPSLDVAVVERDVCGGGASGRNGGFVLSWWAKLLSLRKVCGPDEAARLARASEDAVHEVGRFCDRHGVDAHYRKDGWLWAATSAAQLGAWRETEEAAAKAGDHPFEELGGDEAAARAGSPVHVGGVLERVAASVQPALLARGMRRVALERGIRIYEGSPMVELEQGRPPRVRTPSGRLAADRVVLAMNAWAARFAEIRKAIVVVSSDMIATPPIPARLQALGWTDGLTISDGRTLVNYYRTTRDGRIAFGKGGMTGRLPYGGHVGSTVEGASRMAGTLVEWLHRTYPALSDVGADASWTGPIDRTQTGIPFFWRLGGREDLAYGVGFSGNGVGPSVLAGRVLASMALGRRDEWSESPLVRAPRRDFPPEPIRYVGGQLVRAAVAAKDRAEDAGREPGVVTRVLASFAPAGLSPFKGQKAGLD
jgi:putative aminophosphonate oxidoreductase